MLPYVSMGMCTLCVCVCLSIYTCKCWSVSVFFVRYIKCVYRKRATLDNFCSSFQANLGGESVEERREKTSEESQIRLFGVSSE